MSSNTGPTSIAICTRGRGESLRTAVVSALDEGSEPHVVVVDQNDDDRVQSILGDVMGHERLTVIDTDTIGAGRARNLALAVIDTPVVCFTDDDCIVTPGFARTLTDTILGDPSIGLIYAEVKAPDDHDPADGYTPVHVRSERTRTSKWDRSARADRLGLGAGMAARRTDLDAIGGFDQLMGPGGRFPSADDREIALRMLLRGRHVLHVPNAAVIHLGHRAGGAESRALTKRDHIALGAMYAKFLKVVPRRAILPTLGFLGATVANIARASVELKRPAGFGKLTYTIVGLFHGMRTDVDRGTIRYIDDEAADPGTR